MPGCKENLKVAAKVCVKKSWGKLQILYEFIKKEKRQNFKLVNQAFVYKH